ncbi:MAG: type II toxin-antitoxin system VapC family toxin [Chloroflexaceae bacterium]|nr:type II toxin-antitoxin system VapC family toxin [Chloroflexaceae bacterium]
MPGWLLDTNVISELTKTQPAPSVIDFLNTTEPTFLSAITLHELEFGLLRLKSEQKRSRLRAWLTDLERQYGERILPVGRAEAKWAARQRSVTADSGRVLSLADALIAGTAIQQDLVLVTRNLKDFQGLNLSLFDPWQSP